VIQNLVGDGIEMSFQFEIVIVIVTLTVTGIVIVIMMRRILSKNLHQSSNQAIDRSINQNWQLGIQCDSKFGWRL
jgi:hypothetical protein